MRRESKKLYNGNAEIRDYDVRECLKLNENFQIMHNGDIMTLTPEELKSKLVSTSKTFNNENKSYRLLGYEWNPDKVEL